MSGSKVNVGLLVIRGKKELVQQKLQRLLHATLSKVRQRLYVQVEEGSGIKELLPAIYLHASVVSPRIDLRVLLDRRRAVAVDRVFYDEVTDPEHPTFPMLREEVGSSEFCIDRFAPKLDKKYEHVIMGGTFDRLHNGHKGHLSLRYYEIKKISVMLSEAVMLANRKITCGITDGEMNKKKVLWELIQPIGERCKRVVEFVQDITEELECEAIPIYDPFGPAIVGNHFQAIVVSEETLKGGQAVNQKRKEGGYNELDIHVVKLLESENVDRVLNEAKISSSTARRELLGTILKEPIPPKSPISDKHYVIGLTGGIASGKTHIAKYLESQGCEVIDCDLLVHELYANNKELRNKLAEQFGPTIVKDGNIDRNVLGEMVFGDQSKPKRQLLNSIVWPIAAKKAAELVRESNKQIVVIDAALLIEANWSQFLHQVWTVFVPREEAIKRASERLDSQLPNAERIAHSNVVFCSLWDYHETEKQVQKALNVVREKYIPEVAGHRFN